MPLMSEVKQLSQKFRADRHGIYVAGEGSLGVLRQDDTDWTTCRELFHSYHYTNTKILYCTQYDRNLVAFLNHIEDRLKLPEELRAKVYKTNLNNILYIELGPFWKRKCCRQLFTALLRDGRKFDGKNFNHIINRSQYFKYTKTALNYFLKGNTAFTRPRFNGWVTTFLCKDLPTIKTMLDKDPLTRRKRLNANRERVKICASRIRSGGAGDSGPSRTSSTNRAKVSKSR